LNAAQVAEITAAKEVIHNGFPEAIAHEVPRERAAILADEQFSAAIVAQRYQECVDIHERQAQDREAERLARRALGRWENEGGHI
jgi:hypothetical protein